MSPCGCVVISVLFYDCTSSVHFDEGLYRRCVSLVAVVCPDSCGAAGARSLCIREVRLLRTTVPTHPA